MKDKPNFGVGDKIEYKSGKRGLNFGFVNGYIYHVEALVEPVKDVHKYDEWNGWLVCISETNTPYPAGWFRRVE